STSIALLLLLGSRRALRGGGLHALARFDRVLLVLELIALAALIISLGSLAGVWLNAWGALLVLGVVGLGIIVPLLLETRSPTPLSAAARVAALLVLAGGFLLRVVLVLSSGAIRRCAASFPCSARSRPSQPAGAPRRRGSAPAAPAPTLATEVASSCTQARIRMRGRRSCFRGPRAARSPRRHASGERDEPCGADRSGAGAGASR